MTSSARSGEAARRAAAKSKCPASDSGPSGAIVRLLAPEHPLVQGGVDRVAVAGEVLPELEVRIVGDHRHPVLRMQRVEQLAGVRPQAELAADAGRVEVGLDEEDDQPAGGPRGPAP